MVQQGAKVIQALSQAVSPSSSADTSLPGRGCVQRGYETLEGRFDSTHGGFGREPKFPQPGEEGSDLTLSLVPLFLTFSDLFEKCISKMIAVLISLVTVDNIRG